MSTAVLTALPSSSLFSGPVYAYFAPVDRTDNLPLPFDPASQGRFPVNAPPTGWIAAGVVSAFERNVASAVTAVLSGAPAIAKSQLRSSVEEDIAFTFSSWTRIALALSAGVQTLNLLVPATGANANPSGGAATAAMPLLTGSTATSLSLGTSTTVQPGDVLVVDTDYAGAAGYIGSGAPGAYVATAPALPDVHFTRRVSFNTALVTAVNAGIATLAAPLLAGVPTATMKVAKVQGFVDRNAGAFLPEWSALFVVDGVQGDRLLFHYPRMQPATNSAAEARGELAPGIDRWRPAAKLRALPVTDANDGALAVSFRSYLPAPGRTV